MLLTHGQPVSKHVTGFRVKLKNPPTPEPSSLNPTPYTYRWHLHGFHSLSSPYLLTPVSHHSHTDCHSPGRQLTRNGFSHVNTPVHLTCNIFPQLPPPSLLLHSLPWHRTPHPHSWWKLRASSLLSSYPRMSRTALSFCHRQSPKAIYCPP